MRSLIIPNDFIYLNRRKTDFENGFIQRYNLPELKPGYFLSAMDTYINHFELIDPSTKVQEDASENSRYSCSEKII